MKKATKELPLRPGAERQYFAVQHSKIEQRELEKLYPPKRVPEVTERPFPNISAKAKRAA
jgi:hypothetical protein